jgi:hypothetical protein
MPLAARGRERSEASGRSPREPQREAAEWIRRVDDRPAANRQLMPLAARGRERSEASGRSPREPQREAAA